MRGPENAANHFSFRKPLATEIKVQPHWHTDDSDGFSTPEESVELARGMVNILAITDHDRTYGAIKAVEYAEKRSYINLSNQADSHFEVVVGQEISTLDGHMLGIYLNSTVVCGMSAEETAYAVKEQDGLVIIPHPGSSRASGINPDLVDELGKKGLIDAIETVNGGQESLALLCTVPGVRLLKGWVGTENTNAVAQRRYNLNGVSYAAQGGHDGHSRDKEGMGKVITVFEEGMEYRTAIQQGLTGPRTKTQPEIWNPWTLIAQNRKSRSLEQRRRRGDGIICVKDYYE